MKRILALGAALLMILCGCGEEPAVPARKVTDAQELEQLWQEYFSMALLPLQDEFTAPEDIDPNDLAEYCLYSYLHENGGAAGLEELGWGWYRFPEEKMEQQMERYFGKVLDTVWELDPERLRNQLEYDAQTRDFRIRWPLESDWVLPGYRNGDRPWGKELESFQYNGDGTATAVISSEDSLNPGGEPLSRDFYTMKVRAEGDLIFRSMRTIATPTDQANLSGRVIPMLEMSRQEWFYHGFGWFYPMNALTVGDSLILGTYSSLDQDSETWKLWEYCPTDWQTPDCVEIRVPTLFQGFSRLIRVNGAPYLTSGDGLYPVRSSGSEASVIGLPEELTKAIVGDGDSSRQQIGGYDVSEDLRYWVWTDPEGLQLLDTGTGVVHCLRENNFRKTEYGTVGAQADPRILGGGNWVLTRTYGFEWIEEWILVSVETGEEVLFSRDRWEMNCIGDKGLVLTQHTTDFEPEGLYYFDFGTGMLEQLDFDARQYTAKHWIAGESGMAFVCAEQEQQEDTVQRLYRFDFADRSLVDTGVTVSGRNNVWIQPLAVTPDGWILTSYFVHDGEKGVILVPVSDELSGNAGTAPNA